MRLSPLDTARPPESHVSLLENILLCAFPCHLWQCGRPPEPSPDGMPEGCQEPACSSAAPLGLPGQKPGGPPARLTREVLRHNRAPAPCETQGPDPSGSPRGPPSQAHSGGGLLPLLSSVITANSRHCSPGTHLPPASTTSSQTRPPQHLLRVTHDLTVGALTQKQGPGDSVQLAEDLKATQPRQLFPAPKPKRLHPSQPTSVPLSLNPLL